MCGIQSPGFSLELAYNVKTRTGRDKSRPRPCRKEDRRRREAAWRASLQNLERLDGAVKDEYPGVSARTLDKVELRVISLGRPSRAMTQMINRRRNTAGDGV